MSRELFPYCKTTFPETAIESPTLLPTSPAPFSCVLGDSCTLIELNWDLAMSHYSSTLTFFRPALAEQTRKLTQLSFLIIISETFAGGEGGNVLERPHVPHSPLSPETLTHFITVNRKESHAPLPLRASSISWGAQVMIDGAWCEAI